MSDKLISRVGEEWVLSAEVRAAMRVKLTRNAFGRQVLLRGLPGNAIQRLMRSRGVRIHRLARAMGVPMTRVRQVRDEGLWSKLFILDWLDGIERAVAVVSDRGAS